MILAAGLGTRLKPFTDSNPKALAVVNGKTILQRNIEFLAGFDITDLIINVHHFANELIEFLKANKNFGSTITISDESDEVLETGGGLKKARWFFEEERAPFVLMNVDVLTDIHLRTMIEQHNKLKPMATIAVTNRHTSRYFLFDEVNYLVGWKNIKTGEQKISREASGYIQKAFSGIHVLCPKIFSSMHLEGKFSMVDLYLDLAASHTIMAFDHNNSKFVDVGKPESIEQAEKLFA